jgi:hypothetical protein
MGRTLKRVPLDFDAPLKKIWRGYENPHPHDKCPVCNGSGYSQEARRAQERWYGTAAFSPEQNGSTPFTADHPAIIKKATRNVTRGHAIATGATEQEEIKSEARRLARLFNESWSHHLNEEDVAALLKEGRLMDLTHTWSNEKRWEPKIPAYVPTPDEVNVWSLDGFGHDGINCWTVTRAWCERNKKPYECQTCGGDGWQSKDAKALHESWEPEEPPTGEGFQLWETTSEGSPVSPVFKTLDELCAWAAENATTFADHRATKERWKEMLGEDLVCHQEGNAIFI